MASVWIYKDLLGLLWVRHEMLPVWWGNLRPMNRLNQYGGRLDLVLWGQETKCLVQKGFGRR